MFTITSLILTFYIVDLQNIPNLGANTLIESDFWLKSGVCMWIFVNYTPSVYENYWTDNIRSLHGDACTASNKQLAETEKWMLHSSSNNTLHAYEGPCDPGCDGIQLRT